MKYESIHDKLKYMCVASKVIRINANISGHFSKSTVDTVVILKKAISNLQFPRRSIA